MKSLKYTLFTKYNVKCIDLIQIFKCVIVVFVFWCLMCC